MTPPVLKTIANVPIVSTGKYHLGVNAYGGEETTFTVEDLADAVAAVNDPAIQTPRLKLGHASEWGDAEPCFGKVDNLRTGDNGQTIYGDFTGTPAWLADIMPVVYPNRSIEAFFNVKTPTGNTYRMVITAVALLGVTLPGVATLEDLAGLYSETLPEGADIEGDKVEAQVGDSEVDMALFKRGAKASTNLEDVRRSFYEEIAIGDQMFWWIREIYLDPNEVIVDSDDGDLYKMSFTSKGEDVTWGEADPVKVQYVAARDGGLSAEAAVYASRDESRPDQSKEVPEVDAVELRTKLGLPADASDEDVEAKLEAIRGETPDDSPQPAPDPAVDDEDDDDDGDEPEESEAPADPAAVTASAGVVTIDKDALAELQRGAKAGLAADARQKEAERTRVIRAAVDEGKFPPSSVERYEKLWANDPEGTKTLIDSLEKGTVPIEARGGAPATDIGEATDAYPEEWLSDNERKAAAGVGTVTREEV